MDALINLNDTKNVMKVTLAGKDHYVKLQGTTEKPYFCGKDVCNILEYVNSNKALQMHVKSKHKKELKEFQEVDGVSYNDGKAVYISKKGFERLLMKSKTVRAKSVTKQLVETFNLDVQLVDESKEQACIGAIIETLSHHPHQTQFSIGSYRIDLYFTELKLAVECDEHDHRDRNASQEIARQAFIEKQLGCQFYRFNPDAKDFSIYRTIGDLVRLIYE